MAPTASEPKKLAYKVTNWSKYNESLVCRGDITFWFSEVVIEGWEHPNEHPRAGHPFVYSDIAIQTLLTIRELFQSLNLRTYVPEPNRPHELRWTDKPAELQEAVYANRRRTKTEKNSTLQKLRSERVERSFAHVCDTGGARRTRLRGIEKVKKRHLLVAAAHNLAVVMRKLLGEGKPRALRHLFPRIIDALALILRIFWGQKSTGC